MASLNKALQLAPGFPPALEVLKKIGDTGRKGGKQAAEPSQEAASSYYHMCTFPVTDVGPSKEDMVKVIDACTALINSQGGNDEDRAIVHVQRGSMYRRLGKYELALVDYSESLRHAPNSAMAYTGRGNAYRGLKLFDQAIADHTEALRLKPDDATTYNNRGNAWQDLKNNEHAIADYDMSIKLDPNYATAYYNRGNSRLEAGDKDGAVADYHPSSKPPRGFSRLKRSCKMLAARPRGKIHHFSTRSFGAINLVRVHHCLPGRLARGILRIRAMSTFLNRLKRGCD